MGWVGNSMIGLGRVEHRLGLGWNGLGQIALNWNELGWVGNGRIGLGLDWDASGRLALNWTGFRIV